MLYVLSVNPDLTFGAIDLKGMFSVNRPVGVTIVAGCLVGRVFVYDESAEPALTSILADSCSPEASLADLLTLQ